MALNSVWFGIIAVLSVFFTGLWLFLQYYFLPNKEMSAKLTDHSRWTPEMEYINRSRLILGFLHGILVAGLICVFFYGGK